MKDKELGGLLAEIRKGSDGAFEELLTQYLPLVEGMTEKYLKKCDSSDHESLRQELRQEARYALYKAALSYDIGCNGVSFGLYAKVCIRNGIVSELRRIASAERKKRKAELNAREDSGNDDAESERTEVFRKILQMDCGLSAYEKKIFGMLLDGKSVAQIAEITDRSAKSVSNAVFRAKKKIRSIYNKNMPI